MAHILCILAFLFFASCVAENTETEQDLQLQQDTLSWLSKVQEKQESTQKQNLLDLLYKLSKSENGVILQGPVDTEKLEKKRRGLGGMTTQTRGAGCRVFFWKSWTAC